MSHPTTIPRFSRVFWIVIAISCVMFAAVNSFGQNTGKARGKKSEKAEGDYGNLTIKVKLKSRTLIGNPLVWDGTNMQLLRRDGRMTKIPVASHDDYQVLPDPFKPYSKTTIARSLQKEFGQKYQVSVTPSFVVVHPKGDYHTWAKPFEDLNVRFANYFQTRGARLKASKFPMVAVVLRTRREFDRMLASYHKNSLSKNTLGYYSPKSNRVITYDPYEGRRKSWLLDTDTIIHEATHQTAFNRGIHSRYGLSARWVSEGLACMFESPGVNNSYIYTKQSDRINMGRMQAMLRLIANGSAKGNLEKIVRDDRLFRSNPQLAYAYGWGLTFFLAETKSRDYIKFLTDDGKRENFSPYSRSDRVEQFAKSFGSDFENIEATMFNYLKRVKLPVAPSSYGRR
jgi:hypothetical protein